MLNFERKKTLLFQPLINNKLKVDILYYKKKLNFSKNFLKNLQI